MTPKGGNQYRAPKAPHDVLLCGVCALMPPRPPTCVLRYHQVVSNSMLRAVSVVNGVSLEVLMAQELHHPHVVRTYKCVVRSFDNAAGLTPFALPSLGAGTASTSGATMVGRSREPSMALPGAGSGPAPSVRGRLPSGSPLHSPPPPPLPAAPPAAAGQPAPVSTEAAASWPQQQQQRLSAGGAAARSGSQEGGQASDGRAGSGGGPVARPPGGGGAARLDGSAGRVGPRQFSANWQDGEGPMDSFEAEAVSGRVAVGLVSGLAQPASAATRCVQTA